MSVAAWEAIKTTSEQVGWPANWATDLEIDRDTLTTTVYGDPPKKFIFILRENGTHICRGAADAERVARVWKWADIRIYFWDGSELTEHRDVRSAIQTWIDSTLK
jgi:hypothetical protein